MSTDTETRFKTDLAWTTPIDIHWSLTYKATAANSAVSNRVLQHGLKQLTLLLAFPPPLRRHHQHREVSISAAGTAASQQLGTHKYFHFNKSLFVCEMDDWTQGMLKWKAKNTRWWFATRHQHINCPLRVHLDSSSSQIGSSPVIAQAVRWFISASSSSARCFSQG